ncbi:kinase domain-containing protein [Aspergillus varians]
MIPSILDSFELQGPNGTHACYVTRPEMMSLSDAKDASYNRLFKLEVARALAGQLAIAVNYVHSQGVAHGDIHFGNVLIQMPSVFNYEKLDPPELVAITRFDGKELGPCIPSHATLPVWLGEASDDLSLSKATILLSDFGESFHPATEARFHSHSPHIYRAPKTRFEPAKPISFPSDIWSLACTIWDIVGQSPLFEGFLADEDDITREQVDALGILPLEWWDKWDARRNKFSVDGKPMNRALSRGSFRSWDDRFEDSVQEPRRVEGMAMFEPAERDALFEMLRLMLTFRPGGRPSAREVLASEWMVKWALPEAERVRKS